MTVAEKVAYLKGLAEGLDLDTGTKEGKLLKAIVDTLESIAFELEDLGEMVNTVSEEVEGVSDDLADIEEILFGEDDRGGEYEDEDDENEDDEDMDGGACCDDDYSFEVTCPACDEDIAVSEDDLEKGYTVCPKCGERLEFEFDEDEEDEDEEDEDGEDDGAQEDKGK